MNPKQDRSAARTPEDLERKYHLGKRFRQIAQTEAEQGSKSEELTKALAQLLQRVEALEGK